ncbi:zinc transport system substrate-binding protein [Devosia subaequoris]|uniref:High-affinity zinc uptake system protein ZnuA n=1 Tax=Devosia subaequoris TaxID=395930 RepID=A0A7W6IQG9_9HYPH|nr:zinc ABC transporter substrate-binding protein [Devosia subaequoris]MBB4053200.1 zinc transport system substrate-binding protein [Devosia subaequoris]MCP1210669.1 zinc ABC transporter substrate-binding protein [Devosia subaequoris]
MTKFTLPLAAFATLMLTGTALAAPSVVASTKPVHSLVSAVMGNTGTPALIVKGSASPHTYSLRPSDAAALEAADIVFWTGHGMELFLADALETLSTNAQVVELAEAPGIELLLVREGGAFEAHMHDGEDHEHDHEEEGHEEEHGHDNHDHDDHGHGHDDQSGGAHDHEGHDHAHGEGDMHFWLDPENAKLMVAHIAQTLSAADPDNGAAYAANAEAETARLDGLSAELTATLGPVAEKPFIVFHDAYQYFENRFDLTVAGTVTVSPEAMPGAARIDQLRAKVGELGATCVFAEPNFEPAIVRTIVEGTEAKAGTLDPEGSALTEGPDLYPELLRGLANGLVDCLS